MSFPTTLSSSVAIVTMLAAVVVAKRLFTTTSSSTRKTTSRILQAAHFASIKHSSQRRKDAAQTPYINHPITVATIVSQEPTVSEDAIVAALLHDTVEDTNTSFDEIDSLFGPTVRSLVAEMTDDKSLDKVVRKQLQIEHAPMKSRQAKFIALADKIANVEDLGRPGGVPEDWPAERVQDYAAWAATVCRGYQGASEVLERRFQQALRGSFYKNGKSYPLLSKVQ